MHYYIYGNGKLQCDFEYMFPDLEIAGYIDDDSENTGSIKIEHFLSDVDTEFMIIICKRNEERIIEKLETLGLIYGENFCSAHDFFYQLEKIWKLAHGRKIYVWGIGSIGRQIAKKIKDMHFPVYGYLDKKAGEETTFCGYKVYFPEEILREDVYVVVAAEEPGAVKEIKALLKKNNKQEIVDYNYYTQIGMEYDLMCKVYNAFADRNNTFLCRQAFEYVQIEVGGGINICCPDLLECPPFGSLRRDDFQSIWNSERAKIFRLSIMNHTYALCRHQNCYYLDSYEPDMSDKIYEKIERPVSKLKVSVNIDGSCNLRCSSCRNTIQNIRGKEKEEARWLSEKIQKEIIPFTECLYVAGYGEVFVSKIYQQMLHNIAYIPHLGLQSNGLLFSENYIRQLAEKCDSLSIFISIDAASRETYEKIRRGGNFEKLMNNLFTIRSLRLAGVISYFEIAFVLQYENRKEIADFIRLGTQLQVDNIAFTKINNWGTYSEEEFEKISLFHENGMKEEYKDLFKEVDVYNKKVTWSNIGIGDKKYGFYDYDIRMEK